MSRHVPNDGILPQQTRSRGDTNISGVDILPIPPALEFPYPEDSRPATAAPEASKKRPSPERLQSFPFFPPATKSKSSDRSQKSRQPSNRRTSSPGTPNLLSRIGSAPLRPSGPRQYLTERPRLRQGFSSKQQSSVYNPEAWGSDYSESSEDDVSAGSTRTENRSPPDANALHRTSTAPMARRASDDYRRFAFGGGGYKTRGHVSKHDGRLNISLRETANKGYLAKALGATLEHHLAPAKKEHDQTEPSADMSTLEKRHSSAQGSRPKLDHTRTASTVSNLSADDPLPVPKLNIVVMVIGSRGDIQPFLRLGKILKEEYGHRVRIATHPTFKEFVENDAKLEFFNVGGDPAELMAFMVKNPGLIPKAETLKSGEIPRRRAQMFEMFQGFWRACISASDSEPDPTNRKLLEGKYPFVADAIIANPPSFAHIHCAERLGIPLHLMFTFPNTPTQQFPHPLTNIRQTNVDANYANFMSYPLVEMMQWQGLGDLINEFRVKTLGLDSMSMLWAPGQIFRMRVPYSYLWSPGLIPKPPDWGSEINITGFVFLDLASSFKPPDDLAKFLEAGEPPIYIGFGSIVVDDPDKFTELIFEATKKAGVRALVNKGWGGLGGENTPDNIFMLDNTPHDWLFPRVRAVVHHGGAGTTAIGLKSGKPTMIVPFFGDQPFWGAMVAKAGAGAEPVPYKELSSDKLAEGIKFLLKEETQKHAQEMADRITAEGDGAENAVKSFHKQLPRRGPHSFRCSIFQDRPAVWSLKGTEVKLSPLAAHILIEERKIGWKDLRLVRIYDWNDFEGPGEPLSGIGTSLFGSLIEAGAGVGKVPYHWSKIIKRKDARAKHNRSARSEQLKRAAEAGDKEHKKHDKQAQEEQQKRDENHERKVDATLPAGQHENPKSSSGKKQKSARDKGGEAGIESMLPGSNEPVDTNKHPSRFHMPHLRKGSGLGRKSEDRTLVDDREDDSEIESDNDVAFELVEETGRGLKQTGGALAKLPMNLFLALARGLHNAPRLYGDNTVRTTRRITGFQSGVGAAADELMYGVWDGWSGVIRQPYHGAKYDGTLGFFQGVGKGVGGFVLKDLAAILGVPAYTMKGVHKELTKYRQPTAFIRRGRMVEGATRYSELSEAERQDAKRQVDEAWEVVEGIDREIRKVIREQGVRGRVQVWRRRQWLKENGVIENIKGMQRALEAKQAGRDWEVEFREEKARHQQEQERAIQQRKDEKKKRHERDERGRRIKGADVRMKTKFGTYHALNKTAKRAEKKCSRSQSGTPLAHEQLQQHDENDAAPDHAARPRARTHMASADDGVTTADQVLASSPDATKEEGLAEDGGPPVKGRSRDNSGKTLVPESIDAVGKPSSGAETTTGKDVGLSPKVQESTIERERGGLPRMVTA